MKNQQQASKKQIKLFLMPIVIVLLFVIPIFIAQYLYQHHDEIKWFQRKTINHGHLIIPPRHFETLKIENITTRSFIYNKRFKTWLLIYIQPNPCDKKCEINLYNMRHIRIALGKNRNRLANIIITTSKTNAGSIESAIQDPHKTYLFLSKKASIQHYLHSLPSESIALTQGYFYIVDPQGNMMLSYTPTGEPRGIVKDLKRLLNISRIG